MGNAKYRVHPPLKIPKKITRKNKGKMERVVVCSMFNFWLYFANILIEKQSKFKRNTS